MGSRAGFIIIAENGNVEVYYDHWAAQTFAQDAALAGFEGTLARVRSMTPMGVASVQEWEGATWIEGAMLIDIPKRQLVWSEEGEILVAPRIMNHLLEQTWPGWTAVWAPEDARGVIHLAGGNPDRLFSNRHVETRQDLTSNEWFAPHPGLPYGDPTSVTLEDGRTIVWRTDSRLEDLACYGADAVLAFARDTIQAGTSGDGWGERWMGLHSDGSPSWAEAGTHIDARNQTVSWWTTFEWPTPDLEFAMYWPGWTLQALGDNHEQHELLIGGIKLRQPWPELVGQAVARFEKMLDEGGQENPFVRIVGALTEHGHQVEPGPTVLQHVPSSDFAQAHTIFATLAALESSPLPPVRFVDIRGVVHEPTLPVSHSGS